MITNKTYTTNTKIAEIVKDFGDFGRLIFPTNRAYFSGETLGNLRLMWYEHISGAKSVEIVNFMRERVESGERIFYDIYTPQEKAKDPQKADTGLFFFKGKRGSKFAVCNAGGGFAYVGAMQDSFPHALQLAKKGYNAFALIYRPNAKKACEDLARAISFIFENAQKLGVNVKDYSLWGRFGWGDSGGDSWLVWDGRIWGKAFATPLRRDNAIHRTRRLQQKRAANLCLRGRKRLDSKLANYAKKA